MLPTLYKILKYVYITLSIFNFSEDLISLSWKKCFISWRKRAVNVNYFIKVLKMYKNILSFQHCGYACLKDPEKK